MHQLTQDPAEGPNVFRLPAVKLSFTLKSKHFWRVNAVVLCKHALQLLLEQSLSMVLIQPIAGCQAREEFTQGS